jgi:crotonobetainyl-CoA:carnitine CoA-transferase CaiB-like acyl-CoA transferase
VVLESDVPRSAPEEPGPLYGIRVVEIGDLQAEYCGLLLAGLGADVIKVEPPSGTSSRLVGPFVADRDGVDQSIHFFSYNRGKRSVKLDFREQEDVAHFRAFLSSADVVLDSTPRGQLQMVLGLDMTSITEAYPALIHARLTPFGDEGPWRDYAASDLVHLALGGVAMNCGYDPDPFGHYDLPPIAPQAWHAYHIAGEQLAIGIIAALLYRERSGQGQMVSCAVHQAVSANTEIDVMSWVMLRQSVHRQTCRHALPTVTEPSIVFTKDGRWMMTARSEQSRALRTFLSRYGMADGLADDDGRAAQPEGVRPIPGSLPSQMSPAAMTAIQRFTRSFTYETLPWQEAQQGGLLWVPIRKPHENAVDEHWLSRGTFADIEHPELGRSLCYPTSKWISTRGSWRPGRRAPLLGEDTEAVMAAPPPVRLARRSSASQESLSHHGKAFPLQGVRILDFSWFLASSGGTRFLAALGADVLKVEWKAHPDTGRGSLVPEGGREARAIATAPLPYSRDPSVGGQFNNKNAGKRGLSLDVTHPKGLEIAKALISHCDVVAEGFSPGVLERWGLGYDVQKAVKPDIIYVKQSGMGTFGKYGRYRAVGPIAAALSGVSEMSGLPTPAPPAGWGYSYLDWFGAYSMALAILSALLHRERTGEGQWIDASQTEAGILLTAEPVLDWSANGRIWERRGNRAPYDVAAPQGIYRCAGEDRWIAITCRTDEDWKALAVLAGLDDWADDPRFLTLEGRLAHHDLLDRGIERWTGGIQPRDAMAALQAVGIAAGVCQTTEERCDVDPQLRSLEWLTEVEGTNIGRWPVVALPIKMTDTPPHVGGWRDRGAPLYGEDNQSILAGLLGMTDKEIAALTREGVI